MANFSLFSKVNKNKSSINCLRLDSNQGSLMLEVTGLPTVPITLNKFISQYPSYLIVLFSPCCVLILKTFLDVLGPQVNALWCKLHQLWIYRQDLADETEQQEYLQNTVHGVQQGSWISVDTNTKYTVIPGTSQITYTFNKNLVLSG